jgi:hypothetical protein
VQLLRVSDHPVQGEARDGSPEDVADSRRVHPELPP